jgi:hypothetical protein
MNASRVYMLYNTGNLAEGMEAAKAFFARIVGRYGEGHLNTALARVPLRSASPVPASRRSRVRIQEVDRCLLSTTFDTDEEDTSVSTPPRRASATSSSLT